MGPELRRKREYTNPYFLQKMVEMYKIDPLGTCFHKDVFDPCGLNPADYYDKYAPNLYVPSWLQACARFLLTIHLQDRHDVWFPCLLGVIGLGQSQ